MDFKELIYEVIKNTVAKEMKRGKHIGIGLYWNNITFHMNFQPDGEASGLRRGGCSVLD